MTMTFSQRQSVTAEARVRSTSYQISSMCLAFASVSTKKKFAHNRNIGFILMDFQKKLYTYQKLVELHDRKRFHGNYITYLKNI